MAKRRHGGLGRGLDALIPQARREEDDHKDKKVDPDNNSVPDSGLTEVRTDAADAAYAAEKGQEAPVPDSGGSEAGFDVAVSSSEEGKQAEAGSAVETGSGLDTPQAGSASEAGAGSNATWAGAAAADGSVQGNVCMLRLSQVNPNRSQPRRKFEEDSLEELADSIRQFGVLQPILVQKKGGRYEIIAGERRWRASRKAGLREIPAIVKEYSDQETFELSLIENIQRENLNPIEEAKAFKRLLDEFGLRQEDLAARVSKSRTAITNAVRLLKLDERVQDMVADETISMGHARALIPMEIPEEQFLLAQQIAQKKLSVREVEKLIKRLGADKKAARTPKQKVVRENDPALELAYREIEERLKQSLGTKTSIRSGGDGTGRLEIEFYSHEDLEKLVDLLT